MSLNILHISTPVSFRGGEQQIVYLVNSLSNFGINQFLVCPEKALLSDKIGTEYCTVFKCKRVKPTNLFLIHKIQHIFLNNNIDIVHAHDSKAQTIAVLAAVLSKRKVRVVVTRRVLFPVKGWLSKLKYKTSIVHKIICISKAVEQEIRKIVTPNKTILISSAIDLNKFESATKINFPFLKKSRISIAYVAALTYEKDHDTFLKAAQIILKKHKNIVFYIVGSGKLKDSIIDKIKRMNLQENIVLTGFVKNINSLIPQFDYLLFTSKSEGLGTTILDFFLAKKPVITTECGGNNAFALHKKTAMTSSVGDFKTLAKNFSIVHNNATLKEQLISNAYQTVVTHYSIEKLGTKTFNTYKKLLS